MTTLKKGVRHFLYASDTVVDRYAVMIAERTGIKEERIKAAHRALIWGPLETTE